MVNDAAKSLLLSAPETGAARFLRQRWVMAGLGVLVVLIVVGALLPTGWFAPLTPPRLPATPPKPVARPASAFAPPTQDLLLPPPIVPPPQPRRFVTPQ